MIRVINVKVFGKGKIVGEEFIYIGFDFEGGN